MKKISLKRLLTITGISIGALITIGIIIFLIWANNPSPAGSRSLSALVSNDEVRVSLNDKGWYEFSPVNKDVFKAFVFYPGGHVDYRAYASLCREIAKEGFLVILPQMPLSLSFFSIEKGKEIYTNYPKIGSWAIGGHSLGGVAASMAVEKSQIWSGLILIASYPPDSVNLSDREKLRVLSLSASMDGLISVENIKAARKLLPAQTQSLVVEGGNHGQFGDYGVQSGDNRAIIDSMVQERASAKSIAFFLETL